MDATRDKSVPNRFTTDYRREGKSAAIQNLETKNRALTISELKIQALETHVLKNHAVK